MRRVVVEIELPRRRRLFFAACSLSARSHAAMLGAEADNMVKLAQSAVKMREKCVLCGNCLDVCPQTIDIPEHLERVQEFFSTQ